MSPAKKKISVRPVNKPKRVYKKPYNEKHIIGFLFSISFCLTLFLGSLLLVLSLLKVPDIRSIAEYQPAQASEILDRNGIVIERIFTENRTVVPLSAMPVYLPQAFVAAEDSRFYTHPGLDLWSVFRAAINNMRSGRRGQGGSTITQQVARSLLLTPEKTYLRKFKEAILAWRIDTLLSKDDILHIYLNQIYLGNGAYGVEAAAQVYFGKNARNLSLGEAAILAGLPQAPSRYSPDRHLSAARARQRYVLNRMVANEYVNEEAARSAYNSPVRIAENNINKRAVNGYFVQLVKKQAEKILGSSLNRAGVRIRTTMDSAQQKQAADALMDGLKASFPGDKKIQGAFVSLDACNGRVRALVGGRDFNISAFDRSTQARRSAGSLFKPLLYAAAFENGYTPDSTMFDSPLSIAGHNGKTWKPKNFTGKHYGETSLREALVFSRNIIAIKLLRKIGVKRVQAIAERFGIRPPITADLSLALGATGVSLLEITAAYSPFVCEGNYYSPTLISSIDSNDGKKIFRAKPIARQVVQKHVANTMKNLLSEVIQRGTGKRAAGITGLTGGKTGTTNKNRDAWFVGFSGQRVSGVWLGYDDNKSMGRGKSGGVVAAPIWHNFMSRAAKP
ncbi:PBP1A family penicillin-binding protein [Desulfocapsa sp. AH-315-G09]|uniref:peptidoglycan glycosyltransferase n=1 Tax=Desulfotalea psychrophila TaxID=84980 RepID=A0ABS3AX04_9BACT|nr:PBP1A family penicillin-binding protein [Desulfocapsa sp.]MBN4059969.1 PBP1A family penicillin-binding protein [Desulfotalea psychrophila]MBN4065476.1 PBP1A family penicillin-binding protein [Desulfocapsa sp. AH-315-G09]MBN4068417.1 PBP1A family penicillin-binding protein [Desulfotalea psychrophila]